MTTQTSPQPAPPVPPSAPAGPRPAFLRDVVGTVAGNLASPVIGIATSPVLAHALGVAGRGEFAAATSPALLLAVAGTVGLPEAATYAIASGRLHARATLTRVVALSAAAGAVLAVLVGLLAPLVSTGEPEVTSLIRLGGCSLPAVLAVGAVRGAAAGREQWRLVNAEKYVGNGLRLVLVVCFAALHLLQLPAAVAVYLLCPVAAGAVYVPFLRRCYRTSTDAAPARSTRMLLGFGSRTWVGGLTGVVLARLDQVLIAPLAGARELGLYAAAVAIGEIPYVVSGASRDVVLAADAAAPDDGRAARTARLTLLATAAVAGLLAVLAPVLVRLAFGSAFDAAVPMLQLLLLAAALNAPGSTAGALLLSRGHPTARSACLALACVANVALLPVLVPRAGGVGAAWASVLSYGLFSAATLLVLQHRCGIRVRALLVPTPADARAGLALLEAVRGRRG